MLQRRIKYMRVTFPTFEIQKISYYANNKKNKISDSQIKECRIYNCPYTNAYPIPFLGYNSDREFLEYAVSLMQNDIFEIEAENELIKDNDFVNKLEKTYNDNPNLYKKLKNNENLFKKINKEYSNFASITMNSLDEIRYQDKIYTNFWKNNSLIGKTKTASLISKTGDIKDINNILKNSSDEDFGNIKQRIFETWLDYKIDELNNKKNIRKTNKLSYKIIDVHRAFDEKSINVIFNKNSSIKEKKEALNFMNNFIYMNLEENNPGKNNSLLKISQIQQKIDSLADLESIKIAKKEIMEFYEISKKSFDDLFLDNILKEEQNKLDFISKTEQNFKQLKNIPGYYSLNTDEKYYTAYYFDALSKITGDKNKIINTDDFLKKIITDRNIQNPQEIIDNLSKASENAQNDYFNTLNTYFETLNSPYEDEINFPEKITYHPNYNLSLENIYLSKLGKKNLFFADIDKQRNYLKQITGDEANILNEKIKKDWINKELPYAIFKETRKQAFQTSAGIKIYNELKNVNNNLNNIQIKMDNITYSFEKFLQKNHSIKNIAEELEINKNSTDIISELNKKYALMSEQQRIDFDKAIAAHLPSVIDELKSGLDKKEDKELLNILKKECKQKGKNTKSPFLNTMAAILVSKTAYNALDKCLISGTAGLTSGAINTTANVTAASISGSSLGSIFTLVPSVEPITTILFTIAACTYAIGVGQVNNLEKNQRSLIYTLEYNK